MSILAQACGVVTALSDFQVKAMEAINARFFALRRLAELLEQAGDVSGFLPNLQALIPLSAIDLSLYLSMQANCPFLNLPSVGSVADPVGALRRELDTAYAALLARLKLHPHFKLTRLQQRLD